MLYILKDVIACYKFKKHRKTEEHTWMTSIALDPNIKALTLAY